MTILVWVGLAILALFMPVIAIPIAIALIVVYVFKANKTKKANDIRSEIAEITGNSKLIHIEKDTALALNQSKAEVLVAKPGLMKKYSYTDIRQWRERTELGDEGISLMVRDIDIPEWKIVMRDKADRNRWFEILTQEINEGGIAA